MLWNALNCKGCTVWGEGGCFHCFVCKGLFVFGGFGVVVVWEVVYFLLGFLVLCFGVVFF